MFFCQYYTIFNNSFFIEYVQWLLLNMTRLCWQRDQSQSPIRASYIGNIKNEIFIIDHQITLKILEFVLNAIEKVKHVFLLSSMCVFPGSNGAKSLFHSFHFQNSVILQTRMDQRKMNFGNFKMQKWVS